MFLRLPLSRLRSSFQSKLFLIFTLLTALISFFFCTIYIITEIHEKRAHNTEELRLLAKYLAGSIRLPLYAENREALRNLAEEAVKLREIHAMVVTSSDGRILVDMRSPDLSPSAVVFSQTVEVRSMPMGDSLESAITDAGDNSGTLLGTVRLDKSAADLSRKIFQVILLSSSMAVAFWLVVSYLCHLVLRQVVRSFNALMRGVELMQGGDYVSRIEILSDDEPARAAVAINQLAESLRQRDEENRCLTEGLISAMQVEVRSKEALIAVNRSLETEITERTRAEQSVSDSEQTLKSLMDFMPVGVVWTDLEGKVEYLNHFFVERFGYSREDIKTHKDWFLKAYPDPVYRQQIKASSRAAARAKMGGTDETETQMYEGRVTCKNGTVRHVLFKLQVTAIRTIIIMIDITDRELLQEKLIKSQKLESLAVLAGGVAHNFNNALTGVLGYISYARKFLDESHKAYMPLQHAETASKRAAGMANQLLTFARGGAPVKKPVSVRRLIDECVSLSLNGSETQTVVQIPDDLNAVKADEDQLSQVFNNIIINAVQAMPGGGSLIIRAANITMPAGQHACPDYADYVRISFTDQGAGISKADLGRIFDPYFTTKSSGTGLGLASVHSIIHRHGGQIHVDSTMGKGTEFTIWLPATMAKEPQQDFVKEQLSFPGKASGSILVMDDDEMIREFAKETLGFLGYNVVSCANGEEAVAMYKSAHQAGAPFMAAILDLTINSGMGGTEAAQLILAFDANAKLVVSSGYSYDPVMAAFKTHGFSAAVTKPYKADELGRELSRFL